MLMVLALKTRLISINAVFACPILHFISASLLPSDVTQQPKYLKESTCTISSPFTVILHFGHSFFLLITMLKVFLQFIASPILSLSSFTLSTIRCSPSSLSANKAASSAYLIVVVPPVSQFYPLI